MSLRSYSSALHGIRKVLSADFSCELEDFDRNEVVFTVSKKNPGRRKFPFKPNRISLVVMGNSVVVSSSMEQQEWLRSQLSHVRTDAMFSPSILAELSSFASRYGLEFNGVTQKFVCDGDRFTFKPSHAFYEYKLYTQKDIEELYQETGFVHALGYSTAGERPDVFAAAAFDQGRLIGIAGASQDSENMYQIGVDVILPYRGKQVGRELVCRLTKVVLEADKIPYYSAFISNLASINTCLHAGYKPLWLELYTK